VLGAEELAGIHLTESLMMMPGASVSGMYFAHPEARYFNLGRIGRDQVEDYARRRGISMGGGRAVYQAGTELRIPYWLRSCFPSAPPCDNSVSVILLPLPEGNPYYGMSGVVEMFPIFVCC
jgi:hypothetical protein